MILRFGILSCFWIATLAAFHARASEGITSAKIKQVAFSRPWLNLLYYERRENSFRSLVDKPSFFVNPSGRYDPGAELSSFLDLLKTSAGSADSNPQCLFPARYRFLHQHFILPTPVACPKFEAWKQEYAPSEIDLVYASQYMSNPASVFGHSFLLLPSPKRTQGLWLTMNYAAAIPQNTHPLAYVVGGITGWFGGDYSALPFYQRMFQYGSVENRDLWIYKINLSSEELDMMVDHLWELVHVSNFKYYFLDENCAGVLLRTLAATLPEMQDHHRLPLYVHPMEVVKRLQSAGRISSADLIPSQDHVLQATLASLTETQRSRFDAAIANPEISFEDVDAPTSEAVIHFMAFQTTKNNGTLPAHYKNLDRAAHIARSKFYVTPVAFPKHQALQQAPHKAHDSTMVFAGFGQTNNQWTGRLGYRFAIHDLLDADAGFLPNSALEAASVKLGFNDQQIWVEDFTLARIDNFQAFRTYDPKASWRVRGGLRDNLLTANLTDHFAVLAGGYGLTAEWKGQFFYALLTAEANHGEKLIQPAFATGPEVGAILIKGRLKTVTQFSWEHAMFQRQPTQRIRGGFGMSWNLERNLALVSETEWHQLQNPKASGFRSTTVLRWYF